MQLTKNHKCSSEKQKREVVNVARIRTLKLRTYVRTTHAMLMADEKFSTVLIRWEGNNSKRYDGTKEKILLSNVVAINKTAVIEPSFDQLSVGDHIEYEFVGKKGKVQLWCGVVVSTDPDAERWFSIQRAGNNVQTKAMSPY